jgi:hypothetical protein
MQLCKNCFSYFNSLTGQAIESSTQNTISNFLKNYYLLLTTRINFRFAYILFFYAVITILFSCKKEFKEQELGLKMVDPTELQYSAFGTASSAYCWEDTENGLSDDSILKPTLLGARLLGLPYSVAVMQQASQNLTGGTVGISENKWYVRFKPTNPDQLALLEDQDIDLFDYPLDYEIIQEGDYYDDGVTPVEEIPWLYAVVDVNYIPPA